MSLLILLFDQIVYRPTVFDLSLLHMVTALYKKRIAQARGLELVKLVIGYGGNYLYYPRWAWKGLTG